MDPEIIAWLTQKLLVNLVDHASTIILTVFTVSVVGLGPIGRGLGRRLRGSTEAEEESHRLQAEVEQLNERLDFSERLLHQLRPGVQPVEPADTTTTQESVTPV
jgi:hypothetical protein